jgi:enoyl-CoA hydratase/carnithine racemase
MDAVVATKLEDHVLTITLNRPEKLNAFNVQMRDELIAAFDLAENDDVRVVLVTGAGRTFCAGGEVNPRSAEDFPRLTNGDVDYAHPDLRDDGGLVALKVFDCNKPVIGAVNGAAVGFGATFLLPMDIRMASEKARFGFPFAALGTIPEATSTWFLPKIVGTSKAIEWCLTGELVPAAAMLSAGFLRDVLAPEELLPAAYALAHKIAEKAAPVSAALTRQMMWRIPSAAHPVEAHRIESRLLHDRKQTRDMAEGVASFLEKRSPIFTDRVSADMPPSYPWWNVA